MRRLLPSGQFRRGEDRRVIPAQDVALAGATEGCLIGSVVGKVLGVGELVKAITEAAGIAEIARGSRGLRLPGLRGGYACDIPASDKCVGCLADVPAAKGAPTAYR